MFSSGASLFPASSTTSLFSPSPLAPSSFNLGAAATAPINRQYSKHEHEILTRLADMKRKMCTCRYVYFPQAATATAAAAACRRRHAFASSRRNTLEAALRRDISRRLVCRSDTNKDYVGPGQAHFLCHLHEPVVTPQGTPPDLVAVACTPSPSMPSLPPGVQTPAGG
jgi:hypothetical protein